MTRELDAGEIAPALIARALDGDGLLLAIAADEHDAWRLETELRFYAPADLPVLHFPDPETLPYDVWSPHQDLTSERLGLLHELAGLRRAVVVTAPGCLLQRLPPVEYLGSRALLLRRGQQLDLERQRRLLGEAGYAAVSEVCNHGEFAVRGSLLDIFPMGVNQAYRIDLFDDEIDSIRVFDPETQRSSETIDEIRLLPTREVPLDPESLERFRERYRERFPGNIHRSQIYSDISSGVAPGGIEYYLPLFHPQPACLPDYLPPATRIVQLAPHEAFETLWTQIEERHEQRRHDIERPVMTPAELFLSPAELEPALAAAGSVERITSRPPTEEAFRLEELLASAQAENSTERLLFVAESAGRREEVLEQLQAEGITPKRYDSWTDFCADRNRVGLAVGSLEHGCLLPGPLRVVSETELFGYRPPTARRRRAQRDSENLLRDLNDLAVGSPVVHRDHGVGLYQGLTTLEAGGVEQEFLTLEYKGGDKIYVPVTNLELVHRYSGVDMENPPLNSLGSDRWSKTRERTAKRVRDVAAEILEIHARRAAKPGISMRADSGEYEKFCTGFLFVETEDQAEAIEAVLDDLARPIAMDRLVCGDVGFGKTEVALRATFAAVQSGHQVCVLAPTTLLARQHLQTFEDRFADWPVSIAGLSRLRSSAEQTQTLKDLAAGKVDIVIGTHRLLQGDIAFANLGLVIIDEEHRFGVRHKERMKALRAEVDLLTLTATPIPRTLNMSLSGLRDMSVIATPPQRRLSIKTFVGEWDAAVIREACQRELKRGGQIYFLHNRVQDIESVAADVSRIVPEARARVAHGQMPERELEQVMLDFYHNRFNLLVCTTIIESGIDVPNANTIIINRADRLGLAQLHQIRGRVGRSHHRAYAHLLVADKKALTRDAEQRLAAVEAMGELGAGFQLATHDLEIRGAGELLGADQSGQIQEIGFTLYTRMLNRALRALDRGDLSLEDEAATEVDLGTTALLPGDYVPDVHARLVLYKRISNARTHEELRDLKVELIDRFGLLPVAARNLFEVHAIRLAALPLCLERVEAGSSGARLHFGSQAKVNTAALVRLVQNNPHRYRLHGQARLDVNDTLEDVESRVEALNWLLERLAPPPTEETAA